MEGALAVIVDFPVVQNRGVQQELSLSIKVSK